MKKNKILNLFIIFLLLLSYKEVFATNYYVNPSSGNNTNDGLSTSTPWQTLVYSESRLVAGDTLYLDNGTYIENSGSGYLLLTKDGSVGLPITYQAINPRMAIIKASSTGAGIRAIHLNSAYYRTFNGLVFDGKSNNSYALSESSATSSHVVINDSVFKNAGFGVSCNNCSIYNSSAENNTSRDFSLDSVVESNVQLNNLSFSTTSGYGIELKNSIVGVTISNLNVSNYNQSTALIYVNNSNNNTISSSTLIGSGVVAIIINGTSNYNLVNNISINTSNTGGYGIVVGSDVVSQGINTSNNTIRNVNITNPTGTNHAVIFGGGANNILENSYIITGGYGIVDKGTRGSIIRNNIINSTTGTLNVAYPKGATGSYYYNNILRKNSASGISFYMDSNSPTSSTNIILKNNIIISGATNTGLYVTDLNQTFLGNYNNYVNTGTAFSVGGITYSTLSAWKSASTTQEINSIDSIPLFINNNYSQSSDYLPTQLSPIIDAGVNVGLLTDKLGNPIYGTPDIGAYEYQPPYTIGIDEIDIGGEARIYGDGKFRNLNATTSVMADLSITPQEEVFPTYIASTTRPEWMNIYNITWGTSKQWTASSSVATTTVYTVGDLTPNTTYTVKVDNATSSTITGDDCSNGICPSDDDGKIKFTYSGGYSTHTFNIDPSVAPSVSIAPASEIQKRTVTVSGIIDDIGTSNVTSRGFAYGLTTSYEIGTTTENGSFATGTFSVNISNLSCNKNYHVRVYATNLAGTTTSEDLTFKTRSCSATIYSSLEEEITTIPEVEEQLPTTTETKLVEEIKTLKPETTPPTLVIPPSSLIFSTYLKLNDSGAEVTKLQNFLINKGYVIQAGVTGYFGKQTQTALSNYQRANNITPTGTLGPITRNYIQNDGTNTVDSNNTTKYLFTRNLELNSIGEDVRQL